MNIYQRYIIQWEKAPDDGATKVTVATLDPKINISQFAAQMLKNNQYVMVEHKLIEDEAIRFDFTNMAEWDTVQDALDAIITEDIDAKE